MSVARVKPSAYVGLRVGFAQVGRFELLDGIYVEIRRFTIVRAWRRPPPPVIVTQVFPHDERRGQGRDADRAGA